MNAEALSGELLEVLREMDARSASLDERPTIYLVGAGALVLAGISRRATQDLHFIADTGGDRHMNIVTDAGVHSCEVPAGLVSMPRGWRDRASPLPGFDARHATFLVPSLADRLMDKLARGSATVGRLAASVLAAPPSSVFDAVRFRRNFGRLGDLYEAAGHRRPGL